MDKAILEEKQKRISKTILLIYYQLDVGEGLQFYVFWVDQKTKVIVLLAYYYDVDIPNPTMSDVQDAVNSIRGIWPHAGLYYLLCDEIESTAELDEYIKNNSLFLLDDWLYTTSILDNSAWCRIHEDGNYRDLYISRDVSWGGVNTWNVRSVYDLLAQYDTTTTFSMSEYIKIRDEKDELFRKEQMKLIEEAEKTAEAEREALEKQEQEDHKKIEIQKLIQKDPFYTKTDPLTKPLIQSGFYEKAGFGVQYWGGLAIIMPLGWVLDDISTERLWFKDGQDNPNSVFYKRYVVVKHAELPGATGNEIISMREALMFYNDIEGVLSVYAPLKPQYLRTFGKNRTGELGLMNSNATKFYYVRDITKLEKRAGKARFNSYAMMLTTALVSWKIPLLYYGGSLL